MTKAIAIRTLVAGVTLGLLLLTGCSDNSTSSIERRLTLSVSDMEFTAWAGTNPNPAQLKVTVALDGEATSNWSATAGSSWLRIGPGGTDTIFVSVISNTLPAGFYVDSVAVGSTGATNAPVYLTVRLTVLNLVTLSPPYLTFATLAGGAAPPPQNLMINDFAGSLVSFDAVTEASWLNPKTYSSTVPDTMSYSVDITGLPAGHYEDSIVVTSTELPSARAVVWCHLSLSSWARLNFGFGSAGVNLDGLAFADAETGWASGWLPSYTSDPHGIVYRTTDGGDTWTEVLDRNKARFGGVAVLDKARCWVVGDFGRIEFTSDSGHTWVPKDSLPIDSTTDLTDVAFDGYLHGWIVGESGTILHTSDGGQNWVLQSTPTTFDLSGVDFLDTQTGWVVGNHGTILHTGDAGTTWTAQSSGTINDLRAVSMVDDLTGWVVGSEGLILQTVNNGATWTEIEAGTDAYLLDVTFVSALRGWAVGLGGVIVYTDDGGLTWLEQSSGLSTGLTEVFFLDDNRGWIVGDVGAGLKTASGGF